LHVLLLCRNKYFGHDACSPGKRTPPVLVRRLPNQMNQV
jgi:hypothetical protein